jgi:adenylate kinase family enzyme
MGVYVMIVEFIGLPASGKSTLVKHLLTNYANTNLVIYNPFLEIYSQSWLKRNVIKAKEISVFSFWNTTIVFKLVKVIIASEQRSFKDFIRVLFNFLYFFVLYGKYSKSNDIILFDEGYLHNIWAVIYSSKNKQVVLDNVFAFDITPNILIKVECSNEVILERLLQRKSNTRIENETDVSNVICQSKSDIEMIIKKVESIENKSVVKVFKVNNDDYKLLENNSNMIIELIKERTIKLC